MAGSKRGARVLGGIFALTGVAHFVVPRRFAAIVPSWVPAPRAMVYASGVAELACAAGLLTDRAWAGPAAAATLLGVWPANVQMAVDAGRTGRPLAYRVALWARVPLQLPMIKAAFDARP